MTVSRALLDGQQAAGRPFPEPGVPPRFAPDRTCRVVGLDLGLHIDPDARTLRGEARVEVAPLPSGQLDVVLDLGEVTVDAVCGPDGAALLHRHDGQTLRVDGVPAHGGVVVVRYHGSPSRGLYFTGPTPYAPNRRPMAWTQCQDEDGHHLFPCLDHPGLRSPVTLRVTAPARMSVVANGRRDGAPTRSPDGSTQTWTWVEENAIPAYLVAVVVGELDTHTTTMTLPGGREIDVEYVVPEGVSAERVEQAFHRTPDMIAHFSQAFGVDYPWHRYAQVVVHEFIFGGMENAGATVLTDRVIMPPVSKRVGHDLDDLVAHELAHQWFGDLVTCQDWSQAWLNEGWATYAEAIWLAHDQGPEAASHDLWTKLVGYLGEDGERYQRAITHYRFRNPIDLFDRHLYEKGALVLHTLRAIVGEGAFWPAVQTYLRRHAFQGVHTRDFQRVMEEVSGRNLDGFFQQYVHGAGHPVVEVAVSHADGLLTVSVTQTQSGPDVADAFHFPLPLSIVTGAGDDAVFTDVTLPIRERTRAFTLPMAQAPERVEVDPWMSALAEVTIQAPRGWLVASLQADRGPIGRIRAARALAKDGSPEAISALADAIAQDHAWGVHGEIAAALAKQAGARARAALLSRIDDPRHKHRLGVVRALSGLRHPDVAAALDALVEAGDPSYLVVAEALRGLGRQRAPQTAARCREVLDDEAAAAAIGMETWGASLRAAALDALGHTRDPNVLEILVEHTQPAHEPALRAAAARALGQLAEEVDPARRGAADRLMALARDAPFRVRLSALSALGRAGDPRSAAVLRHVHQADPDGRTARTAFEALGRLQSADQSGLTAVTRLRDDLTRLQDENRSLRARVERLEDLIERGQRDPAEV